MSAEILLRRATGLNLSASSVERAVKQRMAQCAISNRESYLQSLAPDELAALIELVVVPESWLFRDAEAFAAATVFVQQRAGLLGRPIRILSIPCAAGEEPYSMAMALQDAGVAKGAFTIDAIDLSAAAIARAQRGIYGLNAFRGQDRRFRGFRARYFARHEEDGSEKYQIADAIREQVQFRQGNLLSIDIGRYAKYYDVIFCRNLLIYFDAATSAAASANLHAILADDGMLFAGYAEVPSFCQHRFAPAHHPLAFALRKDDAGIEDEIKAAPAVVRRRVRGVGPALIATPSAAPPPPIRPERELRAVPAVPAVPIPANLLAQARSLADQGDFRAAGIQCHAYLALVPDSADAYFILGMVSERAQQRDVAEEHWRRCLYLQPDHYEALCHLALLAEQSGNRAGAATLRARATRLFKRRQSS